MFAKYVILMVVVMTIVALVGLTAQGADDEPSTSSATIFYVEYTQYARPGLRADLGPRVLALHGRSRGRRPATYAARLIGPR